MANIEVGMRSGIPQNVHIMEVRCWHGGSIEDVIARMKCRMLVRKAGMGNATASCQAPSLAIARFLGASRLAHATPTRAAEARLRSRCS